MGLSTVELAGLLAGLGVEGDGAVGRIIKADETVTCAQAETHPPTPALPVIALLLPPGSALWARSA